MLVLSGGCDSSAELGRETLVATTVAEGEGEEEAGSAAG